MSDTKTASSTYIVFTNGDTEIVTIDVGRVQGDLADNVISKQIKDFNGELENVNHVGIAVKMGDSNTEKVRIYKIALLVYDELE